MNEFCSAIVVAAGNSRRMGGKQSKVFMRINGISVILRCLQSLSQAACLREIIVVCRQQDVPAMQMEVGSLPKVKAVVPGGNTRGQSVSLGFTCVSPDSTYVAIHDGARPLVTKEEIEAVVHDAVIHGAAALATPVKDTIKVASDGIVSETLPRSSLWAVQTPQVFRRSLYEKALMYASEDLTDDCQIIERAGGKVFLTRGLYTNIKITTAEDLIVAEAIVKEREKIENRTRL